MGNSLVRTVLFWVVAAVLAIVVLKFVFAAIAGFIQMLIALVVLGLIAYAALWVVRRL